MRSVQIILGQRWRDDVRFLNDLHQRRTLDDHLDLVEIRDIIDIVVHGNNITSAVAEESIFGVIGELLDALVELVEGRSHKAIVEFHCEPWELVLVPSGDDLLVSVYSIGPDFKVIALNETIDAGEFIDQLTAAAESLLTELYRISEGFSTHSFVRSFSAQLARLKRSRPHAFAGRAAEGFDRSGDRFASTSTSRGLTLSYTFDGDHASLRGYCGEHALDLHALLFDGSVEAEFDGRTVRLCHGHPFLTVHDLMRRVRQLLNQLESDASQRFDCRGDLCHARLDVCVGEERWRVVLGALDDQSPLSFDATPGELIEALLSLGEMLLADLISLNPHLELNHRLVDLQEEVRELRGWFEDVSGSNHYLEEPEDYIARRGHVQPEPAARAAATGFPRRLAELRAVFARTAWHYTSERIDLARIASLRHGLLVPSAKGLTLLDWESGCPIWQQPSRRIPAGYAVAGDRVLIAEDGGGLSQLDLATGELRAENRSVPVASWKELLGAASYPSESLIVACDAAGRVLGVDRGSGELRWRFASNHGRFVGATFNGPLLSTLSADGFLYAIAPITGELLWKIRLGGLADGPPRFHQGRLYSFVHDALTRQLTIHAHYPFTGRTAWNLRFDGLMAGPASFIGDWLIVPVERHGKLSLRGIDTEGHRPCERWRVELASAGMDHPTPLMPLELDGEPHAIVKSDRAELTCLRLDDGQVRWRHAPDEETWLLYGNLPLIEANDCVLSIAERPELRRLDDGQLAHVLDLPMAAPEFVTATGQLTLVVGDRGTTANGEDLLTGLSLNHWMAIV